MFNPVIVTADNTANFGMTALEVYKAEARQIIAEFGYAIGRPLVYTILGWCTREETVSRLLTSLRRDEDLSYFLGDLSL